MRSFRSMKYQILAAAALLLSGPSIAAAADPTDQAQWSESIPTDEEKNPGDRVEAYIVDGLLHVRRLDPTDIPLWHLILAEADPNQPPTLEQLGNGTAIEVRHANGAYFVRDTFWGTTIAAHRQQLAPEAFASLDTTVRQNGFDLNKYSTTAGLPSLAQLQKMPPETFTNLDSTTLSMILQKRGPETFANLDSTALAMILQKLGLDAFPNPDTTVRQSDIEKPRLKRGITKWEKNGQFWVALGPNADHWDTLIRLTPTVFVPEKPGVGAFADGGFVRWDDAQLLETVLKLP